MSYTSRCYEKVDDITGDSDPVVVLVVEGYKDVSRLVNVLHRGNCEQLDVRVRILRQLKRRNSGREALRLLKRHGGMDFTEDDAEDPVLAQRDALLHFVRHMTDATEAPAALERCRALGLDL